MGGIATVTLGDEAARKRGIQKTILERASPPTFDVAVELMERNRWRVHLDVAAAVDSILQGVRLSSGLCILWPSPNPFEIKPKILHNLQNLTCDTRKPLALSFDPNPQII